MGDNIFHDAIVPAPSTSIEKPPKQHFFQQLHDAEKMRHDARNMTRQQQFDNGLIGVADLDDEELRAGKCRDHTGRIPRNPNKTDVVPRDMYDAMIMEHEQRTDQRLREQLDTAIDVLVGVMVDDTVEPRDRMDAAKYLFERVKGKTPERVQVQTGPTAPWEQVFAGVARITRERSQMLQEGIIDAEVVEQMPSTAEDQSVPTTRDEGEATMSTWEPPPSTIFAPPPAAPSHDAPFHSEPEKANAQTLLMTNAEQIRKAAADAKDLAERRKAAKDRIQGAKKRRIIKRTMGVDANAIGNPSARAEPGESPRESTIRKLMGEPE